MLRSSQRLNFTTEVRPVISALALACRTATFRTSGQNQYELRFTSSAFLDRPSGGPLGIRNLGSTCKPANHRIGQGQPCAYSRRLVHRKEFEDNVIAIAAVIAAGALIAQLRPEWALPIAAVCTFVSGIDFAGFDVWYLSGMVRLDHALIFGLGLTSLWKILTRSRYVPTVLWLLICWTLLSLIVSAIRQDTPAPSGWIPWASILAALLFGAVFKDAVGRPNLVFVMWIAVVASACVVGFELSVGHAFSRLDIEGAATSGRMFNFSATLVIGLALVAQAAGIRPSRSRLLNLVACVLLLTALVTLQQRTVWIVTGVGLVSVLWFRRRQLANFLGSARWKPVSWVIVSFATFCVASLLVCMLLPNSNVHTDNGLASQTEDLKGSVNRTPGIDDSALGFGDSFTDDRNLEWRIAVWKGFAQRQDSPSAWLLGEDLSHDPGFTWSPHSQYVETLRRVGLVGFVLLALMIVSAWRRRRVPGPSLGGVIVPIALVAGITYEWPAILAILLGACLIPPVRDSSELGSSSCRT